LARRADMDHANIALYEWMRGEVERHGYDDGYAGCPNCPSPLDPCPFVAGLAAALGYPGSGEGDGDMVEFDREGRPRRYRSGPPAAPVQSGGAP